MAMMLVLLLMAAAALAMYAPPKPQPVKARRNVLQEELLARYSQRP
jgi:hypothetical protein